MAGKEQGARRRSRRSRKRVTGRGGGEGGGEWDKFVKGRVIVSQTLSEALIDFCILIQESQSFVYLATAKWENSC